MRKLVLFLFLFLIHLTLCFGALDKEICSYNLLSNKEISKIKNISERWPEMFDQFYFKSWIDTDYAMKRFFNEPMKKEIEPWHHPFDNYRNGVNQYVSYKAGLELLYRIPKGKFQINKNIIKELHKTVMNKVYRLDERILSRITPSAYLVQPPGVIKKHFNFGFSPLTKKPLTEKAYEALKSNSYLRFWELPFLSSANSRRGLILFKNKKNAEVLLDELLAWFESNKLKLHPIELIARFQRRFVSIHPFYNGNGRVSRILMERFLYENGLPPALLENHNLDLYMSEDEWVKYVYEAVNHSYKEASKTLTKLKKLKLTEDIPSISLKSHGTIIQDSKLSSKFSNLLYPSRPNTQIKIGGKKLILFKDGFFYHNKGIPYVLHNKTFYPIPDKNYLLYGYNGEILSESNKFGSGRLDQSRRELNLIHERIIINHFDFISKFSTKKDLSSLGYKIADYSIIEKENNKGNFFFYKWQNREQLLLEALKIRNTTNAMAILSPSNGQLTSFERAFHQSGRISIGAVVAQYQRLEIIYNDIFNYAKKNNLLNVKKEIQKKREKSFLAAKSILKKYQNDFNKLDPKNKEIISNHPKVKLLNHYLGYTALSQNTFKEASEFLGNNLYLLRTDLQFVKKVGFLGEKKIKKLINFIPFNSKIMNYLKAISLKNPSNQGLRKFLDQFGNNKYKFRGTATEFDRNLVYQHLHALNYGLTDFVSFSTRADQYINKKGNFSFSNVKGADFTLYFVKVSKSKLEDNPMSGWFNQYEVLANSYIPSFNIVKKLEEKDFEFNIKSFDVGDKKIINDFISDVFTQNFHNIEI